MDWSRVLFVGWGDDGGVSHYRSKLPARVLGAEWVTLGMDGEPGVGEGHRVDHVVVVVQSCWESWQVRAVQRMRGSGALVLANVDDWLPSVARLGDAHQFSGHFAGRRERGFLKFLELCDGAVTSTSWLAQRLRRFMGAKPVMIARNGLDLDRYEVWRGKAAASKCDLTIGWVGGTGHGDALRAVLPDVWATLEANPTVGFTAVGDPLAKALAPESVTDRVFHVPWNDMSFYPVSIDALDIVIAPTVDNDFYRGKSQLRFYEAAAMVKPVVASKHYTDIDDERTGLIVPEHGSWSFELQKLVDDAELRERLGTNAQAWVASHATMPVRALEWRTAIEGCWS